MQIWEQKTIDEERVRQLSLSLGKGEEIIRLLVSRGFDSEEKIDSMLRESALCNPFDLIDMDKAVERIEYALSANESICIYGDYDADGITATALMLNYLRKKGSDVSFYVPDRNTEGYGLNPDAVRSLADKGIDLIITVDNGISAVKEARLIKELGMSLVVTDHHRPGEVIPDCCAVVDPHRRECTSSFKDWCGVGVAFKLICALEGKSLKLQKILTNMPGGIRRGYHSSDSGDLSSLIGDDPSAELLEEYADIIALGTIGDVVSLTDENRVIVKHGLKKINENRGVNPGLAAMISLSGLKMPVSASSAAFGLVPKLNAVGRLAKADEAVLLLAEKDSENALRRAQNILGYNENRQKLGDRIERDIENYILENPECLNERVLIFCGENWHGGLIGIAAARFCEKYGKPCLVITYDDKNAKGSGRSIEGFSLFECISSCSEMLTHFGGHPMAAGFSLAAEDLGDFIAAVRAYAKAVDMPFSKLKIDCPLSSEMIDIDFLRDIERLEPFGQDNPQPLFALFSVTLTGKQFIGRDRNHVRMNFSEIPVPVLKFRVSEESFPYQAGDKLDLAVSLSKNEYNGVVSVSIIAKEIRFSCLSDIAYLRSMRGYERFMLGDRLDAKQIRYITPERDYIASVFKIIRANNGWSLGIEALSARLGDNGAKVCRLLVALDVLFELGVLKKSGDSILLSETNKKVDLNSSEILGKLNSTGEANE